MINQDGVSIIISARNEYPQIVQTITNLMTDLFLSGIENWEFIIADNASEDKTSHFFQYAYANPYGKGAPFQVPSEYQPSVRGLVVDGRLRFVYDPIFSNVGARHKAVQYARYNRVVFADAHIAVGPLTFKYMCETLDKHKGVVHAPVAWMGASILRPEASYQYSYKIGEKIWGTWNRAVVSKTSPFFIPLSGHCFIMVDKRQYMDFGGYDTNQQIYGGGENYLDTMYWLLGSNVMVDPRALVFHLSAGRGYSYNMNSLIHNMILTAYTLGGEKWSERILITYLNKGGTNHDFLKDMYATALREGQEKRTMIARRQVMDLDYLLGLNREHDCDGHCRNMVGTANHTRRPWDIKNDEMLGSHLSFVQVFEDWTGRLVDPEAKALYENSPHQR